MSQTSDDDDEDDDGQRLWRLGEHRGRDFPISPIDEVGRTRRACVRLLVFITQLTAMRTWWAIRNLEEHFVLLSFPNHKDFAQIYTKFILILFKSKLLQRSPLFCANIVKKDPGRARQNSLATAGTNFTKPGAQNKGDLCTVI